MPLFDSFFLAGFESACHINKSGSRLDMLTITQHNRQVLADYELLRGYDIRTVRDGTIWPQIEQSGTYDFSSVLPMLDAANRLGMQVLWNVLHYGCPDDLDVMSPTFVDRFTQYGRHHHLSDHRPARLGRSRALAQQRAVGPVLR